MLNKSIVIPDVVLSASGLYEKELFVEVILLLFQQEKLSLGKAAELLDMSQVRFQRLLSERNICVHYDVAEFREDIEQLKVQGLL